MWNSTCEKKPTTTNKKAQTKLKYKQTPSETVLLFFNILVVTTINHNFIVCVWQWEVPVQSNQDSNDFSDGKQGNPQYQN